jgi:serine/threonine protein kinase
MAYLESYKIVHRDLALRNILVTVVDGKLIAKVADFGLGLFMGEKLEWNVSDNGGERFPIRWTSIEALTAKKFSLSSDVWSFGI